MTTKVNKIINKWADKSLSARKPFLPTNLNTYEITTNL